MVTVQLKGLVGQATLESGLATLESGHATLEAGLATLESCCIYGVRWGCPDYLG